MLRACYEFSRVGFCRAPYVCYPLVFPDSGVLPVQRWRALVGMNQPSGLARAGVVINSFFWHNTAVCLMHCQKVVPAAFVCLAPGRLSDAIFGDRIQPGTVRLTREKRLCADRSTEQTLKKKRSPRSPSPLWPGLALRAFWRCAGPSAPALPLTRQRRACTHF